MFGDFMDVIGIICEYNPFHKGHIYHIKKVKEMYPNSIIIACISGNFTERGEISVLNKWDKTNIAIDNGVDLVVELPFVYATQSADKFAYASLKILNELRVNKIVFGSECNDIEKLKSVGNVQINNPEFEKIVKEHLDTGNNYPTSLSLALKRFNFDKIDSPNDLLGISYIKEIIKNDYSIEPITIKRTNNYHGNNTGNILSGSEIRSLIKENKSVKQYITYDKNILYKNTEYFKLLKYKIITDSKNLKNIEGVDEGIEGRILKYINSVNSLEELINKTKTKRYTYNKINRMFIHILTNLEKNECNLELDYIRVLGFNENGKKYLNNIKKDISRPIITKYKDINSPLLEIEKRANSIYSLIVNDPNIITEEFTKPIYKH